MTLYKNIELVRYLTEDLGFKAENVVRFSSAVEASVVSSVRCLGSEY